MSIDMPNLVAHSRGEYIPDDFYTDAVLFVDRSRNLKIRCFIHLKDAEGEDYIYPSGDEILHMWDDTLADYYDRLAAFPPIEEIIDYVLESVSGEAKAVSELLEYAEDDMWVWIQRTSESGLDIEDHQDEYDELCDILEEMFDYLSICVTHTSFLKDSLALPYLKCTGTEVENDKLYLTFQIYADKLFELQESEKDNYVEVVDDIRTLIGDSIRASKVHILRDGLS